LSAHGGWPARQGIAGDDDHLNWRADSGRGDCVAGLWADRRLIAQVSQHSRHISGRVPSHTMVGTLGMTKRTRWATSPDIRSASFMIETLFQISNILVLPFWLVMIALPHWRWTQRIIASPWIAA